MIRLTALPAYLALLAACATGPSDDFERHSYSRLLEVEGGSGEYVFESRETWSGAADAESVRMRWLAQWLELRGVCAAGYEVVDRRRFGPLEYNPLQADLRYLVRCRASVDGEEPES